MRRIVPFVTMTLISGVIGCDATQNAPPDARPNPSVDAATESGSQTSSTGGTREEITVADLMQSLGMKIFKARINEPGLQSVKRVALCLKSPGSEPSTHSSVEIDDPATPGTLLVFLQEGRDPKYPYFAGIIYQGDNGRTRETSGPIQDDPFKAVVGRQSGVGLINRPGIAIIEYSGSFRGTESVESTSDVAAIYVKVE